MTDAGANILYVNALGPNGPGKVAQTAKISYKEALNIIDRYFGRFQKLKRWLDQTQQSIATNGYVYSAFGRKRRVPNVFSVDDGEQGHAVRSAMNFTVQSVASDINLLAGIDAHNHIKKHQLPIEIFALVHDSLIGACHKNYIVETENILRKYTQVDRGVSIPNSPVGVEFGYGESYAEAG